MQLCQIVTSNLTANSSLMIQAESVDRLAREVSATAPTSHIFFPILGLRMIPGFLDWGFNIF